MNSRRSPVQSVCAPRMSAKATREPKPVFQGLRANIAPVVGVHLGFDKGERSGSRCAEHPFDISGYTEKSRAVRFVRQAKARYLDRSFDRHVLQKTRRRRHARCVRSGCSPARAARHRSRGVADRDRRRTPDIAGLVVPHIESFARGVADRIIGPGGQLVFAAIARPGVAAALGRRLKAELALAITLIHGAGVDWPGPSTVTYSLPPAANPPKPLKNSRSGARRVAGSRRAKRRRSWRAVASARRGRRADRADQKGCRAAPRARRAPPR